MIGGAGSPSCLATVISGGAGRLEATQGPPHTADGQVVRHLDGDGIHDAAVHQNGEHHDADVPTSEPTELAGGLGAAAEPDGRQNGSSTVRPEMAADVVVAHPERDDVDHRQQPVEQPAEQAGQVGDDHQPEHPETPAHQLLVDREADETRQADGRQCRLGLVSLDVDETDQHDGSHTDREDRPGACQDGRERGVIPSPHPGEGEVLAGLAVCACEVRDPADGDRRSEAHDQAEARVILQKPEEPPDIAGDF